MRPPPTARYAFGHVSSSLSHAQVRPCAHSRVCVVGVQAVVDEALVKAIPTPPEQPTPLSARGAWREPALAQWAAGRNPHRPTSPSFYTGNAAFFDVAFYLDAHLAYLRAVSAYERDTGLRVVYIRPPYAGLATGTPGGASTSERSAAGHVDGAGDALAAAGAPGTEGGGVDGDDPDAVVDADVAFERAVQAREAAEAAAAAAALEGRAPVLPSWLLKSDMETLLAAPLKTTEYRRLVHRLNALAAEPNAHLLQAFLDTFRRSKQADAQQRRRRGPDALGRLYATGRRKNAVARVWVVPRGDGDLRVNGRPVAEYFDRWGDREMIVRPFRVSNTLGQCNVWSTVHGGGKTGTPTESIRARGHRGMRDCV
jgi:hypothetical protein